MRHAPPDRNPLRILILLLLLGILLLPGYRVWGPLTPLLFGGPVILALFRGRTSRDFLSWAGYVTAFLVFATLRQFADEVGPPATAGYALWADQLAGGGVTPTIRLQGWLYQYGSRGWFDVYTLGIHLTYFVTPPLVGLALWRWRPRLMERYLVALALVFLLSLVGHVLVPTIPPWMAALTGEGGQVYRVVYDILHRVSPEFYQFGYQVTSGNDVAAMPSAHTAAAAVVGLAGWHLGRGWRVLGAGYAGSMGLALIYLGEHWLVDVVAGIALALVVWQVTGRWWPTIDSDRGVAG